MFELIDRIVGLDVGQRGMTGLLAPARAHAGGPISEAAAKPLADLGAGDVVFILTGSLTRAGVSEKIAENDGPIGVAALARAITIGFNAIPVVLVDAPIMGKVAAMIERAGPNVVSFEQARIATETPRFTAVASMASCSDDDATARAECKALIDDYRPLAVISVERAGMTADGTYRNALGQDYSQGRARLDHVVAEATARGIPTVGVGDGGNEIGMGAVKDAVAEHVPHGEVLCAELATDVVLPAGVSNWGCYGICAALAIITGNGELAHTAALERRLIEASPAIGLVDGMSGRLEPTVDGMPVEVHVGIVELLAAAVRRGLAA